VPAGSAIVSCSAGVVAAPCTFNRVMPSPRQESVAKIGQGEGSGERADFEPLFQVTIMIGIQFRHLSMEEAERCIAEIWTCLEEYQFSSPKISVNYLDGCTVSFTIEL